MRKPVLIVAIVGFIFVSYLLVRQGSFFSSGQNITVEINDAGFSPDKVIITKGSTVTWKNIGEHEHWPASNIHPTHNIYPEKGGCLGSTLDACKGLEKGESFSFTFEEVGNWPMHDHLFPGLIMVVTVVEKENLLNSGSSTSTSSARDFLSLDYGKQMDIIKMKASEDPASAWPFLVDAFTDENGQVVGNAHEFSHVVGNAIYNKFGFDGVKFCDETFAFGCFHGVTEAMLLKEGVGKLRVIQDKCVENFGDSGPLQYNSCIHGTGHGLYTWEGGNLKKSLGDCDVLDLQYSPYCYDGVFMEHFSSFSARSIDSNNPWKFCSDLNERYHLNCARYQSGVFLTGQDSMAFEKAGGYCSRGTSAILRDTCYESLGYYAAEIALGDPAKSFQFCSVMPEAGFSTCVIGAAKETAFQRFEDWQNSVKELCFKLSADKKNICYNGVNW